MNCTGGVCLPRLTGGAAEVLLPAGCCQTAVVCWHQAETQEERAPGGVEWSCKETGMEATSTTQSTATATTPTTGRKTKAKEKQTGE